jgi:Sec-independent protein translocase protein TatA
MFGFSLGELILVLIVALIFIKPQDLPEIANFAGKVFYRGKRLFNDLKSHLKAMEKELGVDDLKSEIQRGIAQEKTKLEEEMTIIVDMYGNEHRVPSVKEIRPDLSEEDAREEIKKLNEENKTLAKKESVKIED